MIVKFPDVGDVQSVLVHVLCDAQTSGGLLISVPEERAAALTRSLEKNGAACAAVIGRVVPHVTHAIVLV